MHQKHEVLLKRMFQRALGLCQGKPGSMARKVAGVCGKSLPWLLNQVNPNAVRYGTGFVRLGLVTAFTICRVTKDWRPLRFLNWLAKREGRGGKDAVAA